MKATLRFADGRVVEENVDAQRDGHPYVTTVWSEQGRGFIEFWLDVPSYRDRRDVVYRERR